MSDHRTVVRHWRARAEELRRLAASIDIPSAKDGIERAAAGYVRLADELEQSLGEDDAKPRPAGAGAAAAA